MKKIPGADNVQLSVQAGSPEYKVIPDKDKMQRLGLTTAYVGLNLRTAFTGNDDASLTENGTEYPVRIWLDDFDRKNYEDVKRLSIVNPMSIPIEISQFAEVKQDNSPSLLERLDRQPSVTLTSESFGRPSGTLAAEAISYLKTQPLPEGVKLTWGADIKTQNESFGALGSVLLISFILIYLIMVALYDKLYLSVGGFICYTNGCRWRIFSVKLVAKSFNLICTTRINNAHGIGNKKCHSHSGLYQSTKSTRQAL